MLCFSFRPITYPSRQPWHTSPHARLLECFEAPGNTPPDSVASRSDGERGRCVGVSVCGARRSSPVVDSSHPWFPRPQVSLCASISCTRGVRGVPEVSAGHSGVYRGPGLCKQTPKHMAVLALVTVRTGRTPSTCNPINRVTRGAGCVSESLRNTFGQREGADRCVGDAGVRK